MRLISQKIDVELGDLAPMSRGEPATPAAFTWSRRRYIIAKLLETDKQYGNDHTHGSSEKYLQRHWYRVQTDSGEIMKLYFDRYKKEWILHSVE